MKSRIIVVDDEEAVRNSLEELFRLEGHDVLAVESGEAALMALQEEKFELMILDLKMPGMDGVDVLKEAKRLAPDMRVVLLTGHGSLDSAIEALRLGAQDYITKPIKPAEILSSVAQGLERHAEQQKRRMLLEQIDSSIKRLRDAEGISAGQSVEKKVIQLEDGVNVDMARREVWSAEHRVSLTPTENKLMKVLLENRGQVLSHRELVLLVQGYETTDWEAPEVLRPLVSRLRRKLQVFPNGERWIVNVRGTGYVFEWIDETGS